jgi:hypothetical protein
VVWIDHFGIEPGIFIVTLWDMRSVCSGPCVGTPKALNLRNPMDFRGHSKMLDPVLERLHLLNTEAVFLCWPSLVSQLFQLYLSNEFKSSIFIV